MTAILGYAELLLEAGDLSRAAEERIEATHAIHRNGVHLLAIINDILDLSKVEAGKMTLESIACSPHRLLAEIDSFMRVRLHGKRIELKLEQDGLLPETIMSDPVRLRQILVNLVGNAIKFTEEGSVRIVARLNRSEPPTLECDVIDTGLGMTLDQTQALFQPFMQADTSTTRKFGGTGLGLTISKRLAQLLGGDVSLVASARGVGTTFRISVLTGSLEGVKLVPPSQHTHLPLGAVAEKTAELPMLSGGCRILLAEDGPDNQRQLTFILKKAGVEVSVAGDGEQAVQMALAAESDEPPFDLILMDMQMPVMDGYKATALLRAKGYRRPIVALTAHAMSGDAAKCFDAGCDAYAAKPVDRRRLLEIVRDQMAAAAGKFSAVAKNMDPGRELSSCP
jgi:CheY-like chemotaxis protein